MMSQQTLIKALPKREKLLELFVQDCRDREMTAESIQHYNSVVRHFFTFIDKRDISPYDA